MKHKVFTYILAFLGVFAFSCNDEAFISNSGEGAEDDGLTLSLKVDIPATRTRAIDMTPGGALYLNNIWIGVYNKNNGNRVLSDSVNLHSRLTESGVTLTDIIKISVNQTIDDTYGDDYCVVGVANYYGIKTYEKQDLRETLEAAKTWEAFANISIDSQQDIPTQTPVLMGYITDENSDDTKHSVIDQLSNSSDKIKIYNQTDVFVRGTTENSGWPQYAITLKGFSTKNYVLNLRRLRSKININLTTRDEQMTITNLEYKVVNVPKSSFLAERRTNTMSNSSQTGYIYSPNSVDVKSEGYITLEEAEWQKPTDNYSFSYEHVENKHWAKSTPKDYHERGKQSDGAFTNLASSTTDWNNNASYVVLRINLRDFKDGRNSLIEYTILEGFCNNSDGVSQVDAEGKTSNTGSDNIRLQDFSCFRNMDYNYNIHIESVDKIYLTVTNSENHPDDQHNGNIWQMKYPEFENPGNLVSDNRITTTKDASLTLKDDINCTVDDENNKLDFEDIAFRLVGSFYDEYREEKIPVDLCYNLAHGELDGFSGLWIDPVNGVTEYFVDTTGEASEGNNTGTSAYEAMENYFNSGSHPDEETMLERFTVNADGDNNTNLKITDFIKKLKVGEVKTITGVNVKGIRLYETADESDGPRNHMIGLYIFDRQRSIEGGNRVKTDTEEDCHYYQIRAIEQYPAYLTNAYYEPINAVSNNGGRIPSVGGTTQQIANNHNNINGGKNMILSEDPDIAFRLLGYYDKDGSGEYSGFYDLCYNFDMDEYPWFNKYMPVATYDTHTVSKNALTRESIPQELLDGIKIQEGANGPSYTIKQFISRVLAGNILANGDYRFVFSQYNKKYYYNTNDERDKSIRGIYIFDKKNRYKQPVLYNESTNSATYQIYAAEQDGIYVPPTKLPLPSGAFTYKQTATYNIIEEYLGSLEVPLLSGFTYNQDYYYELYTTDDSGNSKRSCTLETIMSQSNGRATFRVPMSIAHANARNIYIQSKTLNERLLDSENSVYVDRTTALTNPEWDFTDDNWNRIYRSSHFKDSDNSQYRLFTGNEVEFSGGYNVPPITLSAPGTNQMRGYTQEGNRFLYIQNSGAKVIVKIYRKCKVFLTVGPNGSTNERGVIITAGENSTTVTYTDSQKDFTIENINPNGEALELTFGITSGSSGNIYHIKLTD